MCELVGGPLDGLQARIKEDVMAFRVRTFGGRLAVYLKTETVCPALTPAGQSGEGPLLRFLFCRWQSETSRRRPTHIVHAGAVVPVTGDVQ
jgi:hypothetical protein